MRPGPIAALLLALVNLALAGALWARARPVTYVFTPLVDVVPGSVDGAEASALAAEAKNRIDARDMQDAYARMGSTMDLDALVDGVGSLDDLSAAQKKRIGAILADARADHAAAADVQREILDLEAAIARQVAELDPRYAAPAGAPPFPPPGPPAGPPGPPR